LKEAAYKAVSGMGERPSWKSFDVNYAGGAPRIEMDRRGLTLMVSLSHDAGVVVGVCIAIKTG
jgi:phosphopantetheinyl transferase (holo-ACP synthase)